MIQLLGELVVIIFYGINPTLNDMNLHSGKDWITLPDSRIGFLGT